MANRQTVIHRDAAIVKIIEASLPEKRNKALFDQIGKDFNLTGNYIRSIAINNKLYSAKPHIEARKDWIAVLKVVADTDPHLRRKVARELAEKHGKSRSWMNQKIRAAGIEVPADCTPVDKAFNILALYRELGNMTAVAEKLDTSKQLVSKIVAKARKAGVM